MITLQLLSLNTWKSYCTKHTHVLISHQSVIVQKVSASSPRWKYRVSSQKKVGTLKAAVSASVCMDSAVKEKQKRKQRQIYLSINTVQKYSLLANTPVTAMYYDPQKKRNKVTKCVQVWDFRPYGPWLSGRKSQTSTQILYADQTRLSQLGSQAKTIKFCTHKKRATNQSKYKIKCWHPTT